MRLKSTSSRVAWGCALTTALLGAGIVALWLRLEQGPILIGGPDELRSTGNPQAGSSPPCHIELTGKVAFRSEMSHDALQVAIHGEPCYRALLKIRIAAPDGTLLYTYETLFKPHVAIQWDDPGLPQDAEALAVRILAQAGPIGSTDELPPWAAPDNYYEEHYNVIQVIRTTYESLRRHPRPIFSHPTGYESWRSVIYDTQRQAALVILEGGT